MEKPGVTPLVQVGKRGLRLGSSYIREALGEFIGTMIVGFMCVGAGGQQLVKTTDGFESAIVPVFGIILGIMTAILVVGGVSGGHVNPALSIALAVAGELSWYSVPGYVLSQYLGATVGSLLGWSLIHPSIRAKFGVPNNVSIPDYDMFFAPKKLQIADIFSPLKVGGCTLLNGFATELVLTCFLIMALCGVLDKQSSIKPPGFLVPIMIPLVIASFCFTHEMPTGTLLNPARDLGPRIAAWILGWKPELVFMNQDRDGNSQHWWVVGLFGPIVGGVIGVLIYAFIVGPQVNLDHLTPPAPLNPFLTVKPGDWRNTNFLPKPFPPITNANNPYPPVSNGNPYPPYSTNNNISPEPYPNRSISPYQQGSAVSLLYSTQPYSNGHINKVPSVGYN